MRMNADLEEELVWLMVKSLFNKIPVFWKGESGVNSRNTDCDRRVSGISLRLHHWYLRLIRKSLFKWKIILKGYINMYFEHTTFHLKHINTYSFCV